MKFNLEITMRSGREIVSDVKEVTNQEWEPLYPQLKQLMSFKNLNYLSTEVDGLEIFINPAEIESVLIVKE
jgi:hypothetical protein